MAPDTEIHQVNQIINGIDGLTKRHDVVSVARPNRRATFLAFATGSQEQGIMGSPCRPDKLLNALTRNIKNAAYFFVGMPLHKHA